ncbi:hypothetical protein RBSWK_05606 [Rhodopirellula baltica SWK14]|uniref:Uncharacterized protein n=1 Tax=Rhodopirellula baltica SWK14 TaxID=993516 RepID=L7CA35_RHOBT|nr:hypothetical protein RBSWK_05606 [Rhodopirellula baltica SWK14]
MACSLISTISQRGRGSFNHLVAPERFGSILSADRRLPSFGSTWPEGTTQQSRPGPHDGPIRGENSIETASAFPMDGSLWTLVGASHE